jgi:hypothetical protein
VSTMQDMRKAWLRRTSTGSCVLRTGPKAKHLRSGYTSFLAHKTACVPLGCIYWAWPISC